MPWHPPCALSNLIVTNLSSCQRIDFSIFDCFFLLRPTAKLFAFLRYALIYIIASQLVSLQDVFHLAVQFSKYISGFRLLAIPENDTGSRRRTVIRPLCFFASWTFSPLRLLALFGVLSVICQKDLKLYKARSLAIHRRSSCQ